MGSDALMIKIPDIVLPPLFARIGRYLPGMPPELILVTGLNHLLRHGILPAKMDLLAGHTFQIDILDAGLSLRLAADSQHFTLSYHYGEADLRFAANAADFMRMMLREEDPDTLFFKRKLIIEGDTELGLIVKNLLDSVDWSETPLARFMAL